MDHYKYNLSQQWWEDSVPECDRHQFVFQLVNILQREQSYIKKDNLDHLKQYIKRDYRDDGDGNIIPAGADPVIGLNPTKSAIDTVCARVSTQKVRPMFLTQGGRWKQRTKAKKLQKFVEGLFEEEGFYGKAGMVLRDGAIFGMGFMKFFERDGNLCMERVYPGEIVVDETSAMNCDPRSYFHVKSVPVENLVADFPEYKDQIMTSRTFIQSTGTGRTTHMVRVIEGWHIPASDGTGGRHCICVDGCTIYSGPWEESSPPLEALWWNKPPVGYYGNGAAEDLAGLQEEIDYLMHRIQLSMHVNATAWLLKHESDKTPNAHFTNKIGTIIEWSGEHPPTLQVNPALHQQVFDHVKWLYGICFDDVGVSQMSATSRKPPGIESGVALQTLLDVETQRHGLVQMAWEDFTVRCAKKCIALARKIYKGGKSDFNVKWDGGKYVETIEWSDVNIPEDEYILKCWPTNLMPSTPAGKLDTVEKMMQSGVIDAQTAMMLLDFPDVEHIQGLSLTATKTALWIVDQVIYEDSKIKPRQYHDLELCIKYMSMGLSRAEQEGAPDHVIERGLEWIADAALLLQGPDPSQPPTDGMVPPMDPAMAAMAGGTPMMDPSMAGGGAPMPMPGGMPMPPMDPNGGGGMPPMGGM